MLSEFIQGIHYAFSGFRHIQRRGIKRYVLAPLVLNALLFAVGIWLAIQKTSQLATQMTAWLPHWLDWLSYPFWLLFGLLILLGVFYGFTLLANFIGAPFNSALAEKLEQQLTNPLIIPQHKSPHRILSKQTFTSALQKLLYLALWILPLLLLSCIPFISIIMPYIWFISGAWLLSLEYLDYPMGNHQIPFRQQREILRRHRSLVLGFGSGVLLLTTIPILNLLAMPVAVTGATSLWINCINVKCAHENNS